MDRVDIDKLLTFIIEHTHQHEEIRQSHIILGLREQALEYRDGEIQYIKPLFAKGNLISNGTDTVKITEVHLDGYSVEGKNADGEYIVGIHMAHQDKWHRIWRKPQFKIGDIIQFKEHPNFTRRIDEVDEQNEQYKTGNCMYLPFDCDLWELQYRNED